MTNQEIGRFIACLRKEQNLTQEQLAERIGVSNRSISRWENGNTLPDYSLLQTLAAVLEVSLSELLAGQRLSKESRTGDCVQLALKLAQHEKDILRKKLNCAFGAGLAFLISGVLFCEPTEAPFIFYLLCTTLGFGFLFTGFWINNRRTTVRKDQLNILLTDDVLLRMKTAAEMVQFSMKYQTGHKKQHMQAFNVLASALRDDEYAQFSFIADSCTINNNPGPWHVSVAITPTRILLSGETMRGTLLPVFPVESFDRKAFQAPQLQNGKLLLKLDGDIIKLDGHHFDAIAEKLQQLICR